MKNANHVKDWVNCEEKKDLFPLPVLTRWGTWLKAVVYVSEHWEQLQRYLKTIPEKESAAAMRAVSEMGKADVRQKIGFIAVLGFLCPVIKISESSTSQLSRP